LIHYKYSGLPGKPTRSVLEMKCVKCKACQNVLCVTKLVPKILFSENLLSCVKCAVV